MPESTLGRLVKVAGVPETPVVDVFEHGGDGARLLVGSDSPAVLELWDWRLGPGEHYDCEPHPAGTREMLHVIEGALTLTVYDKKHAVGASGAVLFSADRPHRYANEGTEPLRLVVVVTLPKERLDD